MDLLESGANNSFVEKMNKTDSAVETKFDMDAESFVRNLSLWYSPFLIVLGILGNIISICVFYFTRLRVQTTSYYLSALAISDALFLFQLLPPWLSAVQMSGLFHYRGFCQISVYLSYVTCCISAWIVVAFTLERLLAVVYPLKRSVICSINRTKQVIICITAAAVLLNIPLFKFTVSKNDDCVIDVQYKTQAGNFNLVDTSISFTIPFIIIILANVWITYGVYQKGLIRNEILQGGPSTIRQGIRPITIYGCTRSQQKVTIMLLIVSSVFVILNMPAYTMRVVAYAYDWHVENSSGRWRALQQLVMLLFHTNFGINFLLYCLSGQNFREALKTMLPFTTLQSPPPAVRRNPAFRLAHHTSANSVSPGCCANENEEPPVGPCRNLYVKRWTFNNSRQEAARRAVLNARNRSDSIEMQSFSGRAYNTRTYNTHV